MIYRIPRCYVREDAVQLVIPFDKCLTLISADVEREGILCHYDFNSNSQNINKYLNDTRRYEFPYSKIPIYKYLYGDFYGGFYKKNCVNQILEFNKHYISIINNLFVRDRYVVKDGDEAILYSRVIDMPKDLEIKEINKKELYDMYKDKILICINKNGSYIDFKKNFKDFFGGLGGLIVIKDNNEIVFKMVEIIIQNAYVFMKEYNIPLNNYKLEELKYFNSRIDYIKEPIILPFINPNLDRREISKSKKLVRQLNRKKVDINEKNRVTGSSG